LLRGLTEAEQEFRKEQQQAGIAVARKKGTYKGRKQGTTKANLEKARELKESGLSSAAIADELGISKRTAFRYLLRSQAASGESRKV
jgi:DNA invertase Pin-like site-specific DNA recombinase